MKTKMLCLLALAVAAPAHAAYKCVDEKGRTHVGDTPPPGCANVVMYEVTRGGTVLRTIQPTMTEEQAKAKADAEERAKVAAKEAAEQKRKDVALLSTYANEKEFDVARDRNIEPLSGRIKQSQDRIKDVDKRIKQVKEEMEFYTAGKKKGSGNKTKEELAAPMASELERLEDEKKAINKNIAGYEKEIEELRSKFDVDKRRWVALKQGTVARPAESMPPEAKADPKAKK